MAAEIEIACCRIIVTRGRSADALVDVCESRCHHPADADAALRALTRWIATTTLTS